jgi:hypothetical protein
MKDPEPIWLTHEIVFTFQGFGGLTRKENRSPGLVAASSDESRAEGVMSQLLTNR